MYDHNTGINTGMKKSRKLAVSWYTKAAEAGDAGSQYELGGCYSSGYGVQQSYIQALKWSTRAAEQNSKLAQYAVSLMHARGIGTPQCYEEGLKWCIRAAQLGHRAAQEKLGWSSNIQPINQSYDDILKNFSIAVAKMRVDVQQTFEYHYQSEYRMIEYINYGTVTYNYDTIGCDDHKKIMQSLNSYNGWQTYTYRDRGPQNELDRLLGQPDYIADQSNCCCTIL